MTDCYQCRAENPDGEIKEAVEGPLFPFCCQDHKDKYADEHYGKSPAIKKKRTIEEIQHIIRTEWIPRARKEGRIEREDRETYDIAKEIFG